MARLYYETDANLALLQPKKIAILGYGSQGHAQAQNLRDSGMNVIVVELPGTPNYKKAIEDGFSPITAAEATREADFIQMLLPDEVQARVYKQDVAPNITSGKVLGFSHGFNIHFGQIKPPTDIDVVMLAPKGPGHLVRRQYLQGAGVPGLIAIHQDVSGSAFDLTLAYGKGIGAARAGIIGTTFEEETETDLFGEQVVLCGGVSHLIMDAFQTLVDAGYQPEIAYFECCHELKLLVDLIFENGIDMMRYSISDTAEWGDLSIGPRIINEQTRAEMKAVLSEIQEGIFAKNWILENQAGRPQYNAMERRGQRHLIQKVGKELRAMMPFLSEGRN